MQHRTLNPNLHGLVPDPQQPGAGLFCPRAGLDLLPPARLAGPCSAVCLPLPVTDARDLPEQPTSRAAALPPRALLPAAWTHLAPPPLNMAGRQRSLVGHRSDGLRLTPCLAILLRSRPPQAPSPAALEARLLPCASEPPRPRSAALSRALPVPRLKPSSPVLRDLARRKQ
ncbi:hypothetical protein ZWY2020_011169 [Hordeum vulgare]|nr:hypothetical protein ZWY2020_011169 [Hordeum vulgare]